MVCARFVTFANCRTSRKRLSSTRLAEGGACCSDKYEVSVCRSGEVCAFCQREGMREGGREGQGTHAERQQRAAATSSLSIFRTSPALPGEEVLAARFEQEDAFLCQGSDSLDFSTASYYCDNHSTVCFWKGTINSTIIISARAFHLRTSAAHHSVHSSRRAVATAVCPSEETRFLMNCVLSTNCSWLLIQRPFSNASLLQSGHSELPRNGSELPRNVLRTITPALGDAPQHHRRARQPRGPPERHRGQVRPTVLSPARVSSPTRCVLQIFLTHIFLSPLTCPAGCK